MLWSALQITLIEPQNQWTIDSKSSVAYALPFEKYLHRRNFPFQVGIEDVDDLIADIEQALQTAPK